MNKLEAKKAIDSLTRKINAWNIEYYQENNPSVSDLEYDKALNELERLELLYPEFINENSPTKILGSFASSKFTKFTHQKPMLSLAKAYSYDEVLKYINNIEKNIPIEKINFTIEPKIDGLSIALHYKKGKLVKAVTRGNGIEGEDVTDNIIQIKSIPKTINYHNDLEVRGEVFITKEDFKKININNSFANARNAASGTLRQLDSSIVAQRNLSAFLYELINPELHGISTQFEAIQFIKKLGIPVNDFGKVVDIEELEDEIENFSEIKNTLPYDADGLVIKLNNILLWTKLGRTAKFPKHSIAFKYDVEVAQSKIEKIVATVGRTGKITYVANIEPVVLNQTTVKAATLHNHNFIKTMNINVGDNVNIIKAGEIIPKVTSLSGNKENIDFYQKNNTCPSCHSILVEYENNVDQFCINDDCDDKKINNIYHFCSRNCMDIVGLGLSTIKDFYPKIINKIQDIFTLSDKKNEILKIPRYGRLKFKNIIESIEKSKNVDFYKALFALGIKQIGQRAAKLIANEYQNFSEIISDKNLWKIEHIKTIGPKMLDSIKDFFANDKNTELALYLDTVLNYNTNKKNISTIFANKVFVISGKLSNPRDYYVSIIESNSGKVSSSVSSKTTYLLIGEDPGSKLDKAKELNVEIINEEKFNSFLK
ncbi:NAD-dependent DNA ligase LigA [Mycoplasma sp. 1331]|uniref:DNA ligase n=1 Tax=Mycoplasma tauri TaxID=547987 RepID=A0A953T6S3_9MOLU|nr:NAD-dependent DNA ligase LigA [Mycoplasma tauri]MBZ4195481.1 NAD-dependent DNA ligase LigA [Mycoplasma tauri]